MRMNKKKSKYPFVISIFIVVLALILGVVYINNKNQKHLDSICSLIVENKLEDAESEISKILKKKEDYTLYSYRAYVRSLLNKNIEGRQDIKKAIGLKSKDEFAYVVKSFMDLRDKNIKDAKISMDKSSNFTPKNPVHYVILGNIYITSNDKNKALEYFNKAIKKAPLYSMAYVGRGNFFTYDKKYIEAAEDYEKALEIDPKNQYAVKSEIDLLVNKGDYDKAIEFGKKKLLQKENITIEILSSIANAYDYKKDYNGLITLSERIIKENQESYLGYLYKGWAYYNLNNYEKAINSFNNSIEKYEKESSAYNIRGWSYNSLRKYNEALNDFTKAIKLNPNYFDAYRGLAWTYNNLGKQDKSLEICEKALKINEKNANLYSCMGWNYLEKGKKEKAKEYFNKSISINPNDLDAKNGMKTLKQ